MIKAMSLIECFFRTIPGVSGVVVENIVRSPLEPTAPLTTYRTRFTQINMCHFCLLMTILLYSPTGNRELNFGGGYRRGERVRVPNKRHIHRDAAWSITNCPVSSSTTAAWEEPKKGGKLMEWSGACTANTTRGKLVEARSTEGTGADPELKRVGAASLCASVSWRRVRAVGRRHAHARTHARREREKGRERLMQKCGLLKINISKCLSA